MTVVRFGSNELANRSHVETVAREFDESVLYAGHRGVVPDFTEVRYLADTALAQLLTLKKHLNTEQARLCICGLHRQVRDVFEITRLSKAFEIFATVEEALRSF